MQIGSPEGRILSRSRFSQRLFPKVTKEISLVLRAAFQVHGSEASSSYHLAHKTITGNNNHERPRVTRKKELAGVPKGTYNVSGMTE